MSLHILKSTLFKTICYVIRNDNLILGAHCKQKGLEKCLLYANRMTGNTPGVLRDGIEVQLGFELHVATPPQSRPKMAIRTRPRKQMYISFLGWRGKLQLEVCL